MKYLILALLIALLVSCDGNINRVPLIAEKINNARYDGKVRRIIEYDCNKYLADKNPFEIVKNSCKLFAVWEYYPNLHIEKKWHYSTDPNKPDFVETFLYDSLGNIIENSAKQVGFSAFESKSSYVYNEAGFEVEAVRYYNSDAFGKTWSRVETIYDEYNCPIKIIHYDSTKKISMYYVNKFDNRNRKIESSEFNHANILKQRRVKKYKRDDKEFSVEYTYDNNGKLLFKDDRRGSNSTNIFNFLFKSRSKDENYSDIEYFPNGKVKTKLYKENGNDVHRTYDENERTVELKVYSNNEWKETFTWKYREDGAVIEKSESTARIVGKSFYKKTTYFKVDFNGNWVEKYIIDSENNVIELKVREIEYYENAFN